MHDRVRVGDRQTGGSAPSLILGASLILSAIRLVLIRTDNGESVMWRQAGLLDLDGTVLGASFLIE